MKNNKFSKIKVFNGLKGFVLGFVLSVSLVAGVVYAWNAVWHGTDWIEAGKVVESEKIAENLEYLKQEIANLQTQINNIQGSGGGSASGTVVAGCNFLARGQNDGYSGLRVTVYKIDCWGGASSPISKYSGSFYTNPPVNCPAGTSKPNYYAAIDSNAYYQFYDRFSVVCIRS